MLGKQSKKSGRVISSLILFSFLIITLKGCEPGCLLCKDEKCVICDKENKYYKIGNICTKKELQNCLKSDNGERCQECSEGHYIDFQTQKCVAFTDQTKITNCKTYKFNNDCVSCQDGYFLLGEECKSVETLIKDCLTYKDSKTCAECDGKMLSEDAKECVDFDDPNCMSISTIQCVECNEGYSLYKNKYLYDFNIWEANKLKKYDINNIKNPYYSLCIDLNLSNCARYETFNTCQRCEDGYFLNPDGTCRILPEEPILNCFEYERVGICTQCLEGYYLKTDSECEQHGLKIALCERMSPTNKDLCDKCAEGYYLDSNSCIQRKIIVAQCNTYNPVSDECFKCEDGYELNENKTLCLVKVDNCIVYIKSNTSITCQECDIGFYYHQDGRCANVANPIEGCLRYLTNDEFKADSEGRTYYCKECKDQYYKSGSSCLPHDEDVVSATTCDAFSQTTKNVCDTCTGAKEKFDVLNYCATVDIKNKDNNCAKYNKEGKCAECNEGYYLISEKCLKIVISNCMIATESGTFCQKCVPSALENFFISFDSDSNKCNFSYSHVITNCKSSSDYITNLVVSEKWNTNICSECISPYYPTTFDKNVKFCVPKQKIESNFVTTPNYDNCNIYEPITKSCYECAFNTNNIVKRVNDDGICQDKCAAKVSTTGTAIARTIKMRNGSFFFQCSEDVTIANCKIESQSKCYTCDEGYWPFIDSAKLYDAAEYSPYETYDYIPAFAGGHFKTKSLSYENKFNRIKLFKECVKVDENSFLNHDPSTTNNQNPYGETLLATNYTDIGTLLTNCRFGSKTTIENAPYYGCTSCKWGTTGFYIRTTIGVTNVFFLNSCDEMKTCELGTYYEGLGNHLSTSEINAWVSCHVCNDKTKIVTFTRGDRVGQLTGGAPNAATTLFYKQTDCIIPGYSSNFSKFPTNCLIQEVKGDVSLKDYDYDPANPATPTHVNPFCVGCKPGYKPKIQNGYIVECIEITGCDPIKGLTTFNKCTFCEDGKVLNENMDACLTNPIVNCYIGTDSADKTLCHECEVGYLPTPNKAVCNQVNFRNCLKLNRLTLTNGTDLPYTGDGCKECELGYLAFIPNLTQTLCVKSDEIENRVYNNAGVANCLTYSSRVDCNICTVGFIKPEDSNLKCVLTSTIENCEKYDSGLSCRQCKAGFLLSGGKCLDGSEYISNCEKFETEKICKVCSSGYIPVRFGDKILCYQSKSALSNCEEYDLANTLNKVLYCNKCTPPYYPKDKDAGQTLSSCVSIPSIAHCKTYETSTFKCTECEDDYYISEPTHISKLQKCLKRAADPTACGLKDLSKDSCKQCVSGYYVRNNICQFKPTGVIGCALYKDEINCSKCKNKMYLLGNSCHPVPEGNYIEKCLYYGDETNCSDCEDKYWLRDNQCFPILISNCNLLETENTCKICEDQFFLTASKTCQQGSVDNCKLHASQSTCQLCNPNYFVNSSGQCEAVNANKLISDCLYYINPTLCQQCYNNAILSKDKQTCTTIEKLATTDSLTEEVETNCQAYEYKRECKVCKPGYFFIEGKCEVCNSKFGGSCRFCDPVKNTICHVCNPKYYMLRVGGSCKAYILDGTTTTTDGGDGNNTTDGTDNNGNNSGGSAARLNLMFSFFLLAAFLMGFF